MSKLEEYSAVFNSAKHIHFTGIGGVSMSALAMVAQSQGKTVTGSDITESDTVMRLRRHGIRIFIGHHAENAAGCDLLVYTAAVKDNNPELVYAKSNNIPHFERAVVLGLLMAQYPRSVAVSGTHGKTTTTSMLASVMLHGGVDPTVLVGANLSAIGGNYRVGQSEYAVYEACEYCNSFWSFYPHTAIVLNIDADHLDFFKDIEDIQNSFVHFSKNIARSGALVINGDDANCLPVRQNASVPVITFGYDAHNDCIAEHLVFERGKAVFDVRYGGERLGQIKLNVGGRHNVLNALAALCAAKQYGISFEAIQKGLAAFGGADRRFQIVGQVNGADIVDDYAHHPTEIAATIRTAKDMGYKKTVVLFQPHTFTRTYYLMNEFAEALSAADQVVLTDIYSAREINTVGVRITDLRDLISGACYISDFADLAAYIRKHAAPDFCFILMGAGNINQVAKLL